MNDELREVFGCAVRVRAADVRPNAPPVGTFRPANHRDRSDQLPRRHNSDRQQRRAGFGKGLAARWTDAAPVFAALGDATRLRLVARLCVDGPLSIARLSEGGVTRQAITKHLHALADAGLAQDSRRGRERIWELEPRRLEMARRCIEQIFHQWDAAISRLKAFVEEEP
jgi:DNA-binding transcriptional ArsR family regulator